MHDAVSALVTPHDLVLRRLQALAPPALPAGGLPAGGLPLTPQTRRRRQGEPQQGEQDIPPDGPRGVPGRRAHVPRPLGFWDTAVFDQAAVGIISERPQGPVPW